MFTCLHNYIYNYVYLSYKKIDSTLDKLNSYLNEDVLGYMICLDDTLIFFATHWTLKYGDTHYGSTRLEYTSSVY